MVAVFVAVVLLLAFYDSCVRTASCRCLPPITTTIPVCVYVCVCLAKSLWLLSQFWGTQQQWQQQQTTNSKRTTRGASKNLLGGFLEFLLNFFIFWFLYCLLLPRPLWHLSTLFNCVCELPAKISWDTKKIKRNGCCCCYFWGTLCLCPNCALIVGTYQWQLLEYSLSEHDSFIH